MTPVQRANNYIKAIRAGVKKFGEYSYEDKGPHDVMDMGSILFEIKLLSVKEIAETLQLILTKEKKYGKMFVAAVVVDLDTWDKFDELLEGRKWLSKLY